MTTEKIDAESIKAAAQRIQAAGVIIDVQPDIDWLDIDASSLEGLPNDGIFFLEGESAAGLISEARAYADLFSVPFDDTLAFVVEGYLGNFEP